MMLKISSKCHSGKFPYWLRQSVQIDSNASETRDTLRALDINTVCQSARCPNIHACFARKKCTFLILGDCCTRDCAFCAIKNRETLSPPDKREFFKINEVVLKLGLRKVVITSVTRDDLLDGGAGHFAGCIEFLRQNCQGLDIEILVPDFQGNRRAIDKAVFAGPNVFSHNIETVPRLYPKVRPGADYKRSLDVIRRARELMPSLVTKSGLMVGLGERREEVYQIMEDVRGAGCDVITIGQYLRPGPGCMDVEEFLRPEEFAVFSKFAEGLGFKKNFCSPFSRSSLEQ